MKILIVIDSLGSGGAQKLAVNLIDGFIQKKHSIHLFKYDDKSNFFLSDLIDKGVKVHKIKKTSKIKFFRVIQIITELRAKIKNNKYDGIISFLHLPSFYSSIAKLGIIKGKLIVCELSSSDAPVNKLIKVLFYVSCLISNSVVANSKNEIMNIKKKFLLSQKAYSIYNGLDFTTTKKRNSIKNNNKGLLIIARIAYPKNGVNLVRGILKFYEKNEWAPKLTWVGRKENDPRSLNMQKQINNLIQSNPVLNDKICFVGEIKNVKDLYNTYDALILPSIYEGLPLVICESMISKCFVLASNVCDHPNILGNNRGFLFDPYSPESISRCIQRFYSLSYVEKEEIINRSYEYAVENFSLKKMTDSYEALLK
ncbi:MAG: glycosyltransferase [Bacteroidota bacterium]|nr:glycosyltransferase [Bacteroidota bacterium]